MYQSFPIEGSPSLGVLAYLYSKRNYVHSQFILRMDKKYGINNISELLNRGIIEKTSSTIGKFGKESNCYKTIARLPEIEVTDTKLIKAIDSGLHLLNGWHFNHWNYNYSQLDLNIPEELIEPPEFIGKKALQEDFKKFHTREEYVEYFYNEIKPYWGAHKRDYFIPICNDDKFASRHYNFFTNHKKLLRKFIFPNPVEVDIAYCQPILMADLLLKGFGKTDFTNVLMTEGMDIYNTIGKTREHGKRVFYETVFGVSYPNIFSDGFPETYNILRKIKRGENEAFLRWTNKEIIQTDKRLTIQESDKKYNKAKAMGELHYKVISLMLQKKEVSIMREVWSELKKEGIIFVPIHDSVIVDFRDLDNTELIMNEIWRNNLDKRFKLRMSRKII